MEYLLLICIITFFSFKVAGKPDNSMFTVKSFGERLRLIWGGKYKQLISNPLLAESFSKFRVHYFISTCLPLLLVTFFWLFKAHA